MVNFVRLAFVRIDQATPMCYNSLCSPVLVPQITGGTLPAGPVNEKVSVRHWVAVLIFLPSAVATLPPTW